MGRMKEQEQGRFDYTAEAKARDAALDSFEVHRAEAIRFAKVLAKSIAHVKGKVSSTDVLAIMETHHIWGPRLVGVDKRFMGALFRDSKTWERVGWAPIGSHCRPVAVWRLR